MKAEHDTMCRNEYNVSGRCNRSSCPLANAQYATVIMEEGKLYLCQKTAERSHAPAKLWERTELPEKSKEAAAIIRSRLKYWSGFQQRKCLQRFVRLKQVTVRMRRLRRAQRERIIPIRPKEERRLRSRETRALQGARLETAIEQELLGRLNSGVYGDVYTIARADEEVESDREGVIRDKSEEVEMEMEQEYEFSLEQA